jgi:hypothetical protein
VHRTGWYAPCSRGGLQDAMRGRRRTVVMSQGPASPGRLSQGEQSVLASFLAGRLPAGQLHAELCRAREVALAAAAAHEGEPAVPGPGDAASSAAAPALHAA